MGERMIKKEEIALHRKSIGVTQEAYSKLLGVTGKYVGMMERGQTEISEKSSIGLLFRMLQQAENAPPSEVYYDDSEHLVQEQTSENRLREDVVPYVVKRRCRMIPVIGTAHAGEPGFFEAIPDDWQEWIPTECRDPLAFGSNVKGDSMTGGTSSVLDGDLVIHMPSEEARSGDLVVACFEDGGVQVRDFQVIDEENVRFIPRNPRWEPTVHHRSTLRWVHPIWGIWRQVNR